MAQKQARLLVNPQQLWLALRPAQTQTVVPDCLSHRHDIRPAAARIAYIGSASDHASRDSHPAVHLAATSAPWSLRGEDDLHLRMRRHRTSKQSLEAMKSGGFASLPLEMARSQKFLDKDAANNQIEDRKQDDQAAGECLRLLFRVWAAVPDNAMSI